MFKNVLLKRKTHMGTSNIDVRDSPRKIVSLQRIPRKYSLVWTVGNFY